MILRKDYVQLIRDGKAQVQVKKSKEHNDLLNSIFLGRNWGYPEVIPPYFVRDKKFSYGYMSNNTPFKDLPIIHASDIILDNTVIKVESEEHGKRVTEWWKEQGVDTEGCMGSAIGYYYGIHDGKFTHYEDDFVANKKIITLPETPTKQKSMKKITPEQAQEIIDIACKDWKGKLSEQWAKNIVLKKDIEVSDSSYNIMRKACTEEQNKLFDKIFGEEKEEINLRYTERLKGIKADYKANLMVISSNNTITLNDTYNWTLDGNILTISHKD